MLAKKTRYEDFVVQRTPRSKAKARSGDEQKGRAIEGKNVRRSDGAPPQSSIADPQSSIPGPSHHRDAEGTENRATAVGWTPSTTLRTLETTKPAKSAKGKEPRID